MFRHIDTPSDLLPPSGVTAQGGCGLDLGDNWLFEDDITEVELDLFLALE